MEYMILFGICVVIAMLLLDCAKAVVRAVSMWSDDDYND